jgi:hypothetical protein
MGPALSAGVGYGLAVFAMGFILGTVRNVLMRLTGLERDLLVLIELPVILAFAWWVAGQLVVGFPVARTITARLIMGAVMLVLLRLGELWVGAALMGQSITSHVAGLFSLRGLVEFAPQALTALFPLLHRMLGR